MPDGAARDHRQPDGRRPDRGRLRLGDPDEPPNPTTSNLNFPLGDTRANGITVPLAGGSDAWIVYKASTSGKRTHLILDVSGYFE